MSCASPTTIYSYRLLCFSKHAIEWQVSIAGTVNEAWGTELAMCSLISSYYALVLLIPQHLEERMIFCSYFYLIEMDFREISKCSNITESNIQILNWIRVSVAIGGFMMVALIFVIVLIQKEFKTILERLFIYLLVATSTGGCSYR